MIGDTVGYVLTKTPLKTIKGCKNPEQFANKQLRVWEFDREGGALVINPEGTALAMIDKEDIVAHFKCRVVNGVVVPPNYNVFQEMQYVNACLSRKGGYNNIVKQMVIMSSLHRGEFCDSVLWHFEPKPSIMNV